MDERTMGRWDEWEARDDVVLYSMCNYTGYCAVQYVYVPVGDRVDVGPSAWQHRYFLRFNTLYCHQMMRSDEGQ